MSVKDHKHIVFCGFDANALGVIRSLGEAGIAPIQIIVKGYSAIAHLSRYRGEVIWVNSCEEGLQLMLSRYGTEQKKPFVYTTDDFGEQLLDAHYDELIDHFYFFNCGKQGRVGQLMNKEAICLVAKQCGCRIPNEEVVDTGVLPRTLQYPIITKTLMSVMGAWKGDVYVCHDEEELSEAYSKIQSPKLLLQEYVNKKNEVAIMGFSINGGEQIVAPFQLSYFRCSDHEYGPYMYFKRVEDHELLRTIQRVIKACNFSGCFEIEFLVDQDDSLVFLEVNFRYSFWNYALTYGGVNYPLLWAESTLSNDTSCVTNYDTLDYFTAMSELTDFSFAVVGKRVGLGQWIKEVFSCDVHYYWKNNDPVPAVFAWCRKLSRMIQNHCIKRITKK